MVQSRCDLHVHSKYSDRPSEWILRRLGSPESFTEPKLIYARAKDRGMAFVTISDHNRIDGALAIAHLPDTFISVEVTTYFPEDGAKLHVLACGITEAQFQMIQRLRENIYELRRYFLENRIIHSVAHPLFRVNDRLGPTHVEKLLVLFNRFEGINGTRDPRAADMVREILGNVTPEMIDRLANAHDIEPAGPTPWAKVFTGGSDDHGGVYIASAFTATPAAGTTEQFLQFLREGEHEMGGRSGNSLRLAHSFYHIAHTYYRQILAGRSTGGTPGVLDVLFRRLLERPAPTSSGLRGKAISLVGRIVGHRRRRQLSDVERMLVSEFSTLLSAAEAGRKPNAQPTLTSEETFDLACRISQQLSFSFIKRFLEHARNGNLIDSLQTMASLGPVTISISPYLAAMATQHKDERFLQQVASHFEAAGHLTLRSDRRAWLTDTLTDVNGVARTIEHMARVARNREKDLTVISCVGQPPAADYSLRNFQPVGEFNTPEYDQQPVCVPPMLEMLEYLESRRFSELIISTPGLVGLTGLAAGRLMGLRLVGIYHTDFPQYVGMLTDDEMLSSMTWRYMHWFYDQMDMIFVPSEVYRRQLADGGIDESKLRILGRGVDLERFNPAHRDTDFWRRHGLDDGVTFVYVGRVSQEKNIRRLLDAFCNLPMVGVPVRLAIVGDGPSLDELRRQYRRRDIVFTGFLDGDELAQAYASADVSVFPSTTDTFGNVVLEAAASGLPAIVTDKGGPQELVSHGRTGLVIEADTPGSLREAMRELAADAARRRTLGAAARLAATRHGWESAFDIFWHRDDPGAVTRAETAKTRQSNAVPA